MEKIPLIEKKKNTIEYNLVSNAANSDFIRSARLIDKIKKLNKLENTPMFREED